MATDGKLRAVVPVFSGTPRDSFTRDTDSSRIVVRVRNTWDHEAFRTYVLQCATNAGLVVENTADLARATGDEINRAMLSKWFRGIEQPSLASLRRLAPVIQAPLADLLVLAGRGDAGELATDAAPVALPTLNRIAREINEMLADNSPVPPDRRQRLEELLDRVIEEDRRYMRKRRTRSA